MAATESGTKGRERRKNQEMVAALRARGVYHGKRETRSLADPMQYLKPDLVGTARYRRLRRSDGTKA